MAAQDYCPKCGGLLEYHDDIDQESWSHIPGYYQCPNGHVFDEAVIEGEDFDDDDDYEGELDE